MTQTKTLYITKSNTVRQESTGTNKEGAGNSEYLFVGRAGTKDYDSYIYYSIPAGTWDQVGQIKRATLVMYSSDGQAEEAPFPLKPSERPKVAIRRLLDGFTEGTTPGTAFASDDWTVAAGDTATTVVVYPSQAADALNRFDITNIFCLMAPTSIKRPNGTAMCNGKANYGIGLFGTASTNENIALWGDEATDASLRPYIEFEYEYGQTIPRVLGSITPTGDTQFMTDFTGGFEDDRVTDTLAEAQVQIIAQSVACQSFPTTGLVTASGHTLTDGTRVVFTSLTGGAGISLDTKYTVYGVSGDTFKIKNDAGVQVKPTTTYTAATVGVPVYDSGWVACGSTEVANGVFSITPTGWSPVQNREYAWRARVKDNERQESLWTGTYDVRFTGSIPNAPIIGSPPVLSPIGGMEQYQFIVIYAGDDPLVTNVERVGMASYQIQMSTLPVSDPGWELPENLSWDTGRRAVLPDTSTVSVRYAGQSIDAGTYYWRARVWNESGATSPWAYSGSFDIDTPFVEEPGQQDVYRIRAKVPWRIVIRDMGVNRGPGDVIGIFENAKSIGASKMYNSPGELHFTLPVDHPQISILEPKQVHYAVEFYQGDGWREVFAGLLWDADATETDVVFYGVDYLGLFDFTYDENYIPSAPNRPAENGGSYYVTRGKNSIGYIVRDQLARAIALQNSPVGFISIAQSQGTLQRLFSETLTVYSTYEPTLSFVTGLLDSHRQGGGQRSRLEIKKSAGTYSVYLSENPGRERPDLCLRYGELVQGYRVVFFGNEWGTRMHAVGRDRNGTRVRYTSKTGSGIDESIWGRFAKLNFIDGVSDGNDLDRRSQQMATALGKLGRRLGVGIRVGALSPFDGYDICDYLPVQIHHGAVDTDAFGSGFWTVMGVAWEAGDQGEQSVVLTLLPREDSVAPSTDLIDLDPISPQLEWQVGWVQPDPLTNKSLYYLNQSTGTIYLRVSGGTAAQGITGDV